MIQHPLKFSLKLDTSSYRIILSAIAPGLIYSIYTHELVWLIAAFFSVCCVLPYTVSHANKYLTVLSAIILFITTSLVSYCLKTNWVYLLIFLLILAIIIGFVDNIHSQFKNFSSWFLIGAIYGGVKLSENGINNHQFLGIIILVFISVGLVITCFSADIPKIKIMLRGTKHIDFIYNFKFVLPVFFSVLAWHMLHLREPEWIFWSSLTVVNTEFSSSVFKFKQRVYAGIIGAVLGIATGMLLPHNIYTTYVCFILIMLSLRLFKDYFPGYLLRTFVIVFYAGSHSLDLAFIRLGNVALGGIIGVICCYLIIQLHSKINKGLNIN